MLNQDKDRVSDETLVYSPASGAILGGSAQPVLRPTMLFVRVWSSAGKRLDCRQTRNVGPLLSLVLDTIRSSGGTPSTDSAEFLSARFADVFSGLQCARRIQWAMEGLADQESFRNAGAAILMDFSDTSRKQSGPATPDWEAVHPGKILLKPAISEVLEGVPGVTLGTTTSRGWRDWSWRVAEPDPSFAADEQLVGRMIQAAGRSDPGAVMPLSTATPAQPVAVPAMGNSKRSAAASDSGDAWEGASRPVWLRTPVVAGAVVALLVLALVVLFFTRKTSDQNATPGTSSGAKPASVSDTRPAPGSTPVAPAPVVSSPAATDRQTQTGSSGKHGRDKKPVVTEPKPAASPAVRCDLTEEDVQRSLARADRYMHAGDLANAQTAYLHVLGCPSAHERAQEGLNRIRRMAAQN